MYYCIDSDADTARFINQIDRLEPQTNIDLIIHTSGGSSNNAKMMVDALITHDGRKRIYIPSKAYSAGTLISLTGQQIYMGKNAHLTPIDAQITLGSDLFDTAIPVGVLSQLSDLSESYNTNLLTIHAKIAEKDYYADLKMLDVIYKRNTPMKQKIVSNFLRTKLPHDYPISVNEAREFGLNISCDLPKSIKEIECFLN